MQIRLNEVTFTLLPSEHLSFLKKWSLERNYDLLRWIVISCRSFRSLAVPKVTCLSSTHLPLKPKQSGFCFILSRKSKTYNLGILDTAEKLKWPKRAAGQSFSQSGCTDRTREHS